MLQTGAEPWYCRIKRQHRECKGQHWKTFTVRIWKYPPWTIILIQYVTMCTARVLYVWSQPSQGLPRCFLSASVSWSCPCLPADSPTYLPSLFAKNLSACELPSVDVCAVCTSPSKTSNCSVPSETFSEGEQTIKQHHCPHQFSCGRASVRLKICLLCKICLI